MPIEVIIDAITNSICDVKTNESFDTEVLLLGRTEVMTLHKKDGWNFNWKVEFKKKNRQLFKLVIQGTNKAQGLMSLEAMDGYIEMHLIESAPHNLGKGKKYEGAPANLVAYACKWSFELGFEGYVGFLPKTQLFEHYRRTLGAEPVYKNRMQITTDSAKKLVNLYYKNYIL
jgi:hypothetical protein